MNLKTELLKFTLVNSAESYTELVDAIKFCSEDGMIKGRRSSFKVEQQVEAVDQVKNGYPPRLLTRSYGIRQQALYLKHYDTKS